MSFSHFSFYDARNGHVFRTHRQGGEMKKTLGILVILILTFSIAVFADGVKPCTADDPPDLVEAYQQALDYLANSQNPDGSWGTLPERDTTLAAEALAWSANPAYQENIDQAAAWCSQTPARNLDIISRKVWMGLLTGNPVATEEELYYSLFCYNPDGGMCLAPGYSSSALDTALGFSAVLREGDLYKLERIAAFLVSRQNEDGSFSLRSGSPPNLMTSAVTNRALCLLGFFSRASGSSFMNDKMARSMRSVDTYLAQVQHADGGFGEAVSTAYETALVLESVSFNKDTAIDRQAAVSFLLTRQLPDGSINGDTATTALFLNAAKPGLRFAQPAISFDNDYPPEGAPLKVRFQVENLGMVSSGPCDISYDTDWGLQDSLPIADIPAGQTIEVEASVPTLGQQGRHGINAVINPNLVDIEFLDNAATGSFFVTAGYNLSIGPEDITTSPAVPDCSEFIALSAKVSNTSTRDANNVGVAFYDGDPLVQGTKLGEAIIPFVDAGRGAVASLKVNLAAGNHDIYVVVDEANAIPELREDDNRAGIQIVVAQAVTIPVPVSPESGAMLNQANPTFTWHTSTGADSITYLLELDWTPGFTSGGLLSYSGIAQQEDPVSFTLPAALPDGTWYWRVRATDGVKTTDALETRMLTTDSNAPVITGPQTQPVWISPNADGSQDEAAIGFALSEDASVDISVVDGQENVVRTLAQGANLTFGTYSYAWDGTDDDGGVEEGAFKILITATDAAGNTRHAECLIGVDVSASQVSDYALSDEVFSPNGDGSLDSIEVSFNASEAGIASLELFDGSGKDLGKAVPAVSLAEGPCVLTWDGKVDGSFLGVEGTFELELRFNDRAGNPAPSLRAPIGLDISAPTMTLPVASVSEGPVRMVTVSAKVIGADLVRAAFAGQELDMVLQNGIYTALFPCPSQPGTYNVTIRAEDRAGNRAANSDVRVVIPATLYGSTMTDTSQGDFEQAASREDIDTAACPGELTVALNQHASPPDLPYTLREAPAYEIGGKIYIFGGQEYDDYGGYRDIVHSQVIVFDPQANSYSWAASMHEARFSPAAAKGTDGRIYLFGGSSTNGMVGEVTVSSAEVYDPSNDVWSYIPSPPNPITRARAATAPDGSIYIFGGFSSTQTDEVLRYDPQNGTYQVVAHLPVARCCHTVVAHGGLFYIMGGHNATGYLQDHWSFDPTTGAWTELASLPLPFTFYQALIGPPDNLYLFGSRGYWIPVGYGWWDRYGRMVFRYDFVSNAWETLPMLQDSEIGRSSSFGLDGVAYLFGGGHSWSYGSLSVADSEAYDPTYKAESVFISRAFHTGLSDFGQITLTAGLPAATTVYVSTRTSTDGLAWTEWSEEIEAPGGDIDSSPGAYFQYRLRLTTADLYRTARVYDVSFNYNRAPIGITAISPYLETLNTSTPKFKWSGVADGENDAATCTLEIDRSPDFSGPELRKYERLGGSFQLPSGDPLADGKWYWRVRATDEKLPGPWSQALSFNIDTTPPEAISESAGPNPFSPDADGTDDQWNLSIEASEEVRSSMTITDAQGQAIKTLPASYLFSYDWTKLTSPPGYIITGPAGHVYSLGDGFFRLDMATGELCDLAYPSVSYAKAVDMQGKLYAEKAYTDNCEMAVFDPATNTWSGIAAFPGTEPGRAACDDSGKLYVFGSRENKRSIWRYDPVANTWGQMSDIPQEVFYGSFNVSCGESGIYYNTFRGTWDYDTLNDAWSMLQAPQGLENSSTLAFGPDGRALIRGNLKGYPTGFFIYDTRTADLRPVPMKTTGYGSNYYWAGAPGFFYVKNEEGFWCMRAGDQDTNNAFTWDGRDDSGNLAAEGEYAWSLEGQDVVGHELSLSGTVEVETSIDLKTLSTLPNPFSPRDPGGADTMSVTYSLGREASIEAAVYEEGNTDNPLYVFPQEIKPAGENILSWDGTSLSRDISDIFGLFISPADWRVPDGNYSIRIKATTTYGGWEETWASIEAVNGPFSVGNTTVTPEAFSPNGDGSLDTCIFSFDISEDAYLTVFVRTSQGMGLVRLVNNQLYPAGRVELTWDGTYPSGGSVGSGTYSFYVSAYTARGKSADTAAIVEVQNPPAAAAPVPQVALPSAEPNHAGEPAGFEVLLPSSARYASLELDGTSIPLTVGEGGRWSCEIPNMAGPAEATLLTEDETGKVTETSLHLELAGCAGEHHLVITDAEDFQAGSSEQSLTSVPGWLSNWRPAEGDQAWQQLPDPPFGIMSSVQQDSVTYNGKIYVFGGGAQVWTLDPAGNTYEAVAEAPESLNMLCASVSGDLIYLCGGGTDRGRTGNFLYAFDPEAGTFTSLAPMPELRYYHTMVAANGKLYWAALIIPIFQAPRSLPTIPQPAPGRRKAHCPKA
jgi:N-acetylneuraminic acid mutarotase/flagellar hook assembly protein FlgD/prenyltransferase beta subunit